MKVYISFLVVLIGVLAVSQQAKGFKISLMVDTTARDAEEIIAQQAVARGFADFLSGLLTQAILPSVTNALQTIAELAAQLTAGIAIGGIDGIIGIGKRDAEDVIAQQAVARGFLDFLSGLLTEAVLPAVTNALQTVAELAAQLTAGIAIGGIDGIIGIGKRDADIIAQQAVARGFLDFLSGLLTEAVLPAVTNALQTVAELAAQLTAGIAIGGIDGIIGIGKRDAEDMIAQQAVARGFLDFLSGLLTEAVLPAVTNALQTVAELAAQLTAGIAIGGIDGIIGIGKRNAEDMIAQQAVARGFADFLSGLLTQAILPSVTNALQTIAELAAQLTAGIAIGGIDGIIGIGY